MFNHFSPENSRYCEIEAEDGARYVLAQALIPSLFNISEPLMFGLPVVLNPTYFIPFILNIPVCAVIVQALYALGFGAGMGLPNMKKYTDEMTIDSVVGEGTAVRMTVFPGRKEEGR